jgi:hypothetical protein
MGVPGWQLTISTSTYHTPSVCSSCLGPRETQVEAVVSEKRGNMRHTLRMAFPYCNACADRAKREQRRAGLVIGGGAALGLVLAIVAGAGMAGDIIDEPIVAFVVAVLLACAMAAGIAFATRPALPPAPATARGEAVILRSTDGVLLCTNQRFAELLGNANSATPAPGSTIMSTETWAPLAALLVGALVVLLWIKYAPYTLRRSSPPPPRVTAPAPAPRPAPAPAPRPAQPSKR